MAIYQPRGEQSGTGSDAPHLFVPQSCIAATLRYHSSVVHTEHILPLADKRQLSYLECGDPQGYPVLWCHGNPGSRRGWPLLLSRTGSVKARVIIPDRPGFGKSDPQPSQSYLAWPADIVQLVDALDIEQFVVAGVSGGGPFALACACQLSDRVAAVGLISTGPPVAEVLRQANFTNRLVFTLGRRAPHLIRFYSFLLSHLARRRPNRMIRQLLSGYGEADSPLPHRPDLQDFFRQYLGAAYAQGGRASADEIVRFSRSWHLPLPQITTPVHLWHGEADTALPPSFGRHLAEQLPHCSAQFIPAAGHLWILDHLHEVLEMLLREVHPTSLLD